MANRLIPWLVLFVVIGPARSLHGQVASASAEALLAKFEETLGDAGWEKLVERLGSLNADIRERGMLPVAGTHAVLLTGYSSNEFYDWDLYFENIYLSYYGINDFCFSNFKAFLAIQAPDGFVSRSLKRDGTPDRKTQDFKPFLAQIAVLGSRQHGNDFEWLRTEYYDKLKKFVDRWFKYDRDGNGLPAWDSADASGMDNQTRRAGKKGSYDDEGVDLACYLVRELRAMAVIAGELGKADEQADFSARADRLSKTINDVLWDEKDGFYYDRNEKTNQPVYVKTVAGFIPLWAGVATPQRAARLIKEHLTNDKEFWLKSPVATYALTEPDFYEGRRGRECNWHGTTWIPTNYMIFHGLMHYGYKGIARDLAQRTLHMALDENPVTREYYDSDTGRGNGLKPFWGWSSLAYGMPLEYQLNYDPTDLNSPIRSMWAQAGIAFAAEATTKGQ